MGRGEHSSLCILFGDPTLPRLEAIANERDGFRLAEIDLELRGAGDVLGTRQHGLPEFKVARLPDDVELLVRARERFAAASVVPNQGPRGLSGARNTGLMAARGDLVVYLDDDARAEPDWLAHLADAFTDSSVAAAGGTGFHAEQRYEYHRPVRVGDVLSVHTSPGRSWEKMGRRGGRLTFTETVTEYRDEQGELVVTATSVGIVTEKAVE